MQTRPSVNRGGIDGMLSGMANDLPRTARLASSRQFRAVFEKKCSAADARLVVYVTPNESHRVRLGVVVGRRHGSAARRNRVKRLIREAFRLSRGVLPVGFDLVVVPREGTAAELSDYVTSLRTLTVRCIGRWRAR